MQTNTCTECQRTFKTTSGLDWHQKHIHGLAGEESRVEQAFMGQEAPAEPKTSFARLKEATPNVIWTSSVSGEIARALVGLQVLNEADVPRDVLEQPPLSGEPHRIYLIA